MKRRSVTFTDSPPEIIGNNDETGYMRTPLPGGSIFLDLQLAKLEQRQERNASETCRQWQLHRHSRSAYDLCKQHHYLSLESEGIKYHLSSNKENQNHTITVNQKERTNPVYLIPNLRVALRSQHLLAEGSKNHVTRTGMNDFWRKERKLLQQQYDTYVSSDCMEKYRNTISTIDDDVMEAVINDIANVATDSSVKSIPVQIVCSNNNDGCKINGKGKEGIVKNERQIQCYSATDYIDHKKADNGDYDTFERVMIQRCTDNDRRCKNICVDNAKNSALNNIKNKSDRIDSEIHCRKVVKEFARRNYYHHLTDCKKFDSKGKIDRNWSWSNVTSDSRTTCRCYWHLNKSLKQKNYLNPYNFISTSNTSVTFIAPTSSSNSMRNVFSHDRCYYRPYIMCSKTQQQLADGNLVIF
uniref:Uncharacterized protein n=1 Tax=Setaria digitata TaxID=48799 RepID=A0A915Q1L6_9BILA